MSGDCPNALESAQILVLQPVELSNKDVYGVRNSDCGVAHFNDLRALAPTGTGPEAELETGIEVESTALFVERSASDQSFQVLVVIRKYIDIAAQEIARDCELQSG